MSPRVRLPGGRGSGEPPPRTSPREGRGGTSSPWMMPHRRPWRVSSRTRARRGEGAGAAASDAVTGRLLWSSHPRGWLLEESSRTRLRGGGGAGEETAGSCDAPKKTHVPPPSSQRNPNTLQQYFWQVSTWRLSRSSCGRQGTPPCSPREPRGVANLRKKAEPELITAVWPLLY